MLDLSESRYDRQERISWWDQSRLRAGRVLVVGAGAIGNELVKNLALVGVGHIDVVDMDRIEHTNLARCVFFREGDEGRFKAAVVAEAAAAMNRDITVRAFCEPVQALGSGTIAEYDVVLGALDNREARLWVNAACRRLGMTWIDAAIEGLHGVVRTFGPEGPCYECTLTDVDWQILAHRRSCALLGVQDMLQGKTPTNATTAGVVAAIQVQEAIKLLVGRDDLLALVGRQWSMLGEQMVTFTSIIDEDPDCMAHYRLDGELLEVRDLQHLASLFDLADGAGHVELADDFIVAGACPSCELGGVAGLRSVLPAGAGSCPSCGAALPASSLTLIPAGHDVLGLPFRDIVWPRAEIVTLSTPSGPRHARVWGNHG